MRVTTQSYPLDISLFVGTYRVSAVVCGIRDFARLVHEFRPGGRNSRSTPFVI